MLSIKPLMKSWSFTGRGLLYSNFYLQVSSRIKLNAPKLIPRPLKDFKECYRDYDISDEDLAKELEFRKQFYSKFKTKHNGLI